MANRTITLDTIGSLAENGYILYACCEVRGCLRVAPVDLGALVRSRGADMPVGDVKARLRCTACGSRETSIRIAWALPSE